MNMSQSQAEAAVQEISENASLGRKLDDYLRRFATGELNRQELGLRIEMLLDDADMIRFDQLEGEGKGASHADDARKGGEVA